MIELSVFVGQIFVPNNPVLRFVRKLSARGSVVFLEVAYQPLVSPKSDCAFDLLV